MRHPQSCPDGSWRWLHQSTCSHPQLVAVGACRKHPQSGPMCLQPGSQVGPPIGSEQRFLLTF